MHQGFVKSYRKILDSQVFENPNLLKLWIYIIHTASYKEHFLGISTGRGITEVRLLPGQCLFGRLAWSKKLKIPSSTIRDMLKKLESIGNIDIQPDTHYSIITVTNWGTYQNEDLETTGNTTTNRQATDNQPTHTRKKRKKRMLIMLRIYICIKLNHSIINILLKEPKVEALVNQEKT